MRHTNFFYEWRGATEHWNVECSVEALAVLRLIYVFHVNSLESV